MSRLLFAMALLLGLGACRTGRDYAGADAPRYYGAPADTAGRRCERPCEIRIVSFNIEFAREIDGPRTSRFGRLDHILMKGLQSRRSGTVILSSGVSDHHPVWASGILPQ